MSVPEWVKGLARNWGREVRRFEKQIEGIQGTMGRIMEEGPDGAAIRSYRDTVPVSDFSRDVQTFHRAWLDLKPELKAIIWLDFKVRGKTIKKMKDADMPKTTYYRTRREALTLIARDFHLYQNSQDQK